MMLIRSCRYRGFKYSLRMFFHGILIGLLSLHHLAFTTTVMASEQPAHTGSVNTNGSGLISIEAQVVSDAADAILSMGDLLTAIGELQRADGTRLADCDACGVKDMIAGTDLLYANSFGRERGENEFAVTASGLVLAPEAVFFMHASESEFTAACIDQILSSNDAVPGSSLAELQLSSYSLYDSIDLARIETDGIDGPIWFNAAVCSHLTEDGEQVSHIAILAAATDADSLIPLEMYAFDDSDARTSLKCGLDAMMAVLSGTACGACFLSCFTVTFFGCLSCAGIACCMFLDRLLEAIQQCDVDMPASQVGSPEWVDYEFLQGTLFVLCNGPWNPSGAATILTRAWDYWYGIGSRTYDWLF